MAWRTYTPDGRTLAVDYVDGMWTAECDGAKGVGQTAAEAMTEALREDTLPLGTTPAALAQWVEVHAARLEREAADDADADVS